MNEVIISLIILGISGLIFIIFLNKRKYRESELNNYDKQAHKIKKEEPEEDDDEEDTTAGIELKEVNISRVMARVVMIVLALYVGGTIMSEMGSTMNNTCSPFYEGLSLIGWTITPSNMSNGGCITETPTTGILSIIAIVGIVSIIFEFVRMRI